MSFSPRVAWVIALDCEARPIRDAFGLAPVPGPAPYPIYRSPCETHWMVRSGIGRNHGAAATMYLHQIMGGGAHIAWLNVGIAGHANLPLGTGRRVNQILEVSTGATFYPTQVFDSQLMGCSLFTVDEPQKTMDGDGLYDMEGSAFFSIASRLSSQELVMLIKCVSDHGVDQDTFPSRDTISGWISTLESTLMVAVDGLLALSAMEADRLSAPDLDPLLRGRHFTVTQTHQLRSLMRRWTALKGCALVDTVVNPDDDARGVILRLKNHLDSLATDWREP